MGSSPFGGLMARRHLKLYGKKATANDVLLEINNLLYAKGHIPSPLKPVEIAKVLGLSRKTVYNYITKLSKTGNTCNIKELSDQEFLEKLEEKSSEEITEYQNDKNPEELADILEVIYRIAQLKGISKEELEKIRIKKLELKN